MNQKKQLEQMIIEKAIKDELFREQLKSDPKETIERELGFKIPDSINLTVLEEDPQTVFLVLPDSGGSRMADELTEAELEGVAGGWSGDTDDGSSCDDQSCPV
jgi:hypothetical protein